MRKMGTHRVLKQLAEAIAKSNRLMAEDILREAGYMLPQSGNTHSLLQSLLNNPPGEEFPKEAAERLLELLPDNDREKQEEKEEKIEKMALYCMRIYSRRAFAGRLYLPTL